MLITWQIKHFLLGQLLGVVFHVWLVFILNCGSMSFWFYSHTRACLIYSTWNQIRLGLGKTDVLLLHSRLLSQWSSSHSTKISTSGDVLSTFAFLPLSVPLGLYLSLQQGGLDTHLFLQSAFEPMTALQGQNLRPPGSMWLQRTTQSRWSHFSPFLVVCFPLLQLQLQCLPGTKAFQ